jgi:cation diffusion facilitator CzcD-associated flavoprotein CzcO
VHQPRIAIVGAGFGGVGFACRLLAAGYRDLVLYERGSEVGGVWSANTYPGAACDVPAQLYSFSFAPNPRWSSNFPPQPEIRAYVEQVAVDHGVMPLIRFGTTVESVHRDGARWLVTTDAGEDLVDWVVFAVGQLSAPATPRLPGADDFAGVTVHSAQWDAAAPLDGRRVGVVGTGASAIQLVPHLARRAEHLTVFQRSAPYVIPKHEVRFDRGRGRDAFARVPALQRFSRGLTWAAFETRGLGFTLDPRVLRVITRANTALLAEQVPDPELRERLTPTEPVGCKRVLLSNDYYPSLARPDVTVETDGIARLTPTGVRTVSGHDHLLDVLVYATGFRTTEFLAGIEVSADRSLHEVWQQAGGAESFRGGTVAGFPNLAILYGPNTNLGHSSILYMLESQFAHLVDLVTATGAGTVEPRPAAQQAWNGWVSQRMQRTAFVAGCDSWYATAEGKQTNNWPSFTISYRRRLHAGDLADYTFSSAA